MTGLLTVLGAMVVAALCLAFAAAGPLLALHDRMPNRVSRTSCPKHAVLAAPQPNEATGELVSVPASGSNAARDDAVVAA